MSPKFTGRANATPVRCSVCQQRAPIEIRSLAEAGALAEILNAEVNLEVA